MFLQIMIFCLSFVLVCLFSFVCLLPRFVLFVFVVSSFCSPKTRKTSGKASETLRQALAMGADRAIHLKTWGPKKTKPGPSWKVQPREKMIGRSPWSYFMISGKKKTGASGLMWWFLWLLAVFVFWGTWEQIKNYSPWLWQSFWPKLWRRR